jgi:hypothetical protein
MNGAIQQIYRHEARHPNIRAGRAIIVRIISIMIRAGRLAVDIPCQVM